MCVLSMRSVCALLIMLGVGCAKVDQLAQTSLKTTELQFITSSMPAAAANQNYSIQVFVKGGSPEYLFELKEGSFPNGLSIASDTGIVTGVIGSSATGTYNFTLGVTDKKGKVITGNYFIKISTTVSINTTTLPAAQINTVYTQAISASGGSGTYTYSALGLPTGMSIATSTGVISGTATVGGSANVTITVVDSDGMQASKVLTFFVTTPLSLPVMSGMFAGVGQVYSKSITTVGGQAPYTYSISAGALPLGLNLTAAGVISGTPAKGDNVKLSPHSFTVELVDGAGQTASRTYSVSVTIPPYIVSDVDMPLRHVGVGVPYSEPLRTMGGYGALVHTATGLPAGLVLGSANGVITGTATAAAANYNVVFTVKDANNLQSSRTKVMRLVASGKAIMDPGMPITMTPWGPANNGQSPSATWNGFQNIAVGDMDEDGFKDLIISSASTRILVGFGDGTGKFGEPVPQTMGYASGRIYVYDINQDGHLDILATDSVSRLNILSTATPANWRTATTVAATSIVIGAPADLRMFAFGDVNGDTKPDIVATTYTGNAIRVIINCGAGVTAPFNPGPTVACTNPITPFNYALITPAITLANNPHAIELIDMNKDNKLDIIFGTYLGATNAGVILGNGDGSFQTGAIQYTSSGASNLWIAKVADFDGDTNMDVVFGTSVAAHGVSIIYGKGNDPSGVWGSTDFKSTSDMGGNLGYSIDVGDVNGDGKPDIVSSIGAVWRSGAFLFINNGNRNYTRISVNTGGYYNNVVLGDVVTGGTTRPDLIVSTTHSANQWGKFLTYRNTGNASEPYPINQYMRLGIPDIETTAYGPPVAADFNRDGYPDLIFKTGATAVVFKGSVGGAMTLQPVPLSTGESGSQWYNGNQTAISDINGDGYWDYLSANYNSGNAGTVNISTGVGDGTFFGGTVLPGNPNCQSTGLGARAVDTADFNRDGNMDVAVATGCGASPAGEVYIWLGYGDGSFNTTAPIRLASVTNYVDLVLTRDFNGDAKADVAMADTNGTLRIYFGNGDGTFGPAQNQALGLGTTLNQLTAGDFNADGTLDILVAAYSSSSVGVVLIGAGGTISGFSAMAGLGGYYSSLLAYSAVIGDFDIDGKLDVMVAKNGFAGVHFHKGLNSGSFNGPNMVFSPCNTTEGYTSVFRVADLDQDGMPDIASSPGQAVAVGACTSMNRSR